MTLVICRIEVDEAAIITAVDDAFCALVGETRAELVGVDILAMTPEEDRGGYRAGFARLREIGQCIAKTNRLIRRDGSSFWAHKTCREIASRDGGRLFAITIRPCAAPSRPRPPDKLLEIARTMLNGRRQRNATFGAELFPDVAWHILLSTYVAEAEGRMMILDEVIADSGTTLPVVSRWVRALHEADLLDDEMRDQATAVTSLHLSTGAHEQFEVYLSSLLGTADATRGGAIR